MAFVQTVQLSVLACATMRVSCSFAHTGERVQNRTDVPPGDGYDVVT